MPKLKFDVDSESFDLFFQKQMEGFKLNSESGLPNEILFKLLQGGANADSISTSKMSGMEKIYVLWKALNKKVFITVEDDDDGIGMEEYVKIKEQVKKNPPQIFSDNGSLHIPVTFIKANRELSDTFSYYNHFCNSAAYRHALKIKNKKTNSIAKWKKEMLYISRLMTNYESLKVSSARKLGLDIAEIYVLMYFYDQKEKDTTELYNEIYKKVYGTSLRKIRIAFVHLQQKDLLIRRGKTRDAKFKITALGIDKINDFFKKYITNI